MKIVYLFTIYFAFSCDNREIIQIENINQKKDIILLPFYENQDSLYAYIPYTFAIKNMTAREFRLTDVGYKPFQKFIDDDYLVEQNDSISRGIAYGERILPLSSKTFTFYFKTSVRKTSVQTNFTEDFKKYSSRKKYFNTRFNRIPVTATEYTILKDNVVDDSLALIFDYKDEYSVIKICRVGENKFKTITTDDLIEHPEMGKINMFKP